ncbi:hypothetical protein G7085_13095 [Tessaracoccus sp. HDW20]|uniref:hypothetical protein n=1 Tax=Tessaracoccus coleopterorum TaxID=2714950 RepID=UPI0018D35EAE|nr:hypothetical protein [Tessaracoccus coleopterorum]NHB85249.1 hypothetical protein [Tessaracoccus coleopterorum]
MQDSRGEQAYGQLIIEVDEAAPNIAPVARDDSVPLSGIIDQRFVELDPLLNDFDPDGAKSDLRIEVADAVEGEDGARVDESGTRLTVPVKEYLQQVRYLVIDSDGARSSGIVIVPGTNDIVPALIDPELELKPTAGQTFIIDINEYVRGTQGRSLELITADNIWATNGADAGPDGESRIRYTADRTFAGPASLVFEVRDKVANPSDKTGRSAVISIPLEVLPAATGEGPPTPGLTRTSTFRRSSRSPTRGSRWEPARSRAPSTCSPCSATRTATGTPWSSRASSRRRAATARSSGRPTGRS